MKRLTSLEQYMKREVKETLKDLNLPSIRVLFNNRRRISFTEKRNGYRAINLDSVSILVYSQIKQKNDILFASFKDVNSITRRIKFILYHEIGHYIEHQKYSRWNEKYAEQKWAVLDSGFSLSETEYRAIKHEHIADRLANGILKRRQNYDTHSNHNL